MRRVAIIDYGSGNLRSAAKAFEHVADTDTQVQVTSDAASLTRATHIVLPGVGAFADCMQGLSRVKGMRDAMEEQVRGRGKPFLGICVGMQLLFDEGHEHGVHPGLGWIAGNVVRIAPGYTSPEANASALPSLKIPHMGWNELTLTQPGHRLLSGIAPRSHAYFVHSYHAHCANAADIVATTDYGQPLTAIVARGNIMGTQFHPEKSQETGLTLIRNFLAMD